MNRSLVGICVALMISMPLAAGEDPRSVTADPLVGAFADVLRPGQLQVSVRWGEITVRGHDSDEVRVESSIEVDADTAARLTDAEILKRVPIRLVERGNTIEVEVAATVKGFYAVDLTIFVPRGTSLALEMRDGGNIDVAGVGGELEISNRNGSVDLSGLAAGTDVYARNGAITAEFSSLVEDLPISFSSLNGSVDVTFPETPSADVKIRYNRGGVESDFPIIASDGFGEVEADTTGLDGRATRMIEGRIGDGGTRYYFHTANGTVYLRRAEP